MDPVYETLKVAAETRKRTLANYLQQRQQTLNKQTSLNSQGSSEIDIQPSPRTPRLPSHIEPSPRVTRQTSHDHTLTPSGKRSSLTHFPSVVQVHQLSTRRDLNSDFFSWDRIKTTAPSEDVIASSSRAHDAPSDLSVYWSLSLIILLCHVFRR